MAEQLHLSLVDSLVQLRPQFHHIDAMLEHDRTAAKGQREAANPVRQQEARAGQMAVKSVDGEDFDMSHTMKTLKDIQEETWTRMEFRDENVGLANPVEHHTDRVSRAMKPGQLLTSWP